MKGGIQFRHRNTGLV